MMLEHVLKLDRLIEAANNISVNAKEAPDPATGGITDCYVVPLEDIDALTKALADYRVAKRELEAFIKTL